MSNKIILPDGFTCQPVTMKDLETAVSFLNTCAIDDIGVAEETPEGIRTFWQSPGFDLATSTLAIFSPEGQMVGYTNVIDTMSPPVQPWAWIRIHPDFKDSWMGPTLFNWVEARARQAISRVPEGLKVSLRASALSTAESHKRLLESHGMAVVRHFWRMAAELDKEPPAPQWPEGIILRTYQDYPDLRTIFRALDEGFQDHWGFIEGPEEEAFHRFAHFLENNSDFDPSLCLVAMEGDEIAGVCVNLLKTDDDPEMGWVDDLSVRRPWRRRGLALALLHHSFGEFYRRGKKRVGLGVDSQSLTGATRLYERAGMRPTRQWDSYQKELRPGRDISKQTVE